MWTTVPLDCRRLGFIVAREIIHLRPTVFVGKNDERLPPEVTQSAPAASTRDKVDRRQFEL
jgi:hypothetical protein